MINITTDRSMLAFLLRDSAPEGVSVRFGPIIERRHIGPQEVIDITVILAGGIPGSIVAAWLYDKLKGQQSTKIRIHRTEIHCDDGDLKRVIEETISIDYKS